MLDQKDSTRMPRGFPLHERVLLWLFGQLEVQRHVDDFDWQLQHANGIVHVLNCDGDVPLIAGEVALNRGKVRQFRRKLYLE